ncbi:hypothetical protein Cgig2_008860 [Carnegiea gigantea]|uniref:Retrotransposon gag domain-containing protein n=1 Tax=Carnegiea gigantea TaxID=171969 RepID=A0A9Q1JM54_9CARY|nr:hypothetical protein Cgig2_008860 [Carnegiea gigantea]
MKQNKVPVSEYYTKMRGIWEELDSMGELLVLTVLTDEIVTFLNALGKQQQEHKLFQFLNGLDDEFGPQRSQILLMTPLPSIEAACVMLQQEELQREALNEVHVQQETSALLSKGIERSSEGQVLQIIGYPNWHPRSRRFPQKRGGRGPGGGGTGRGQGQRFMDRNREAEPRFSP